MQLTKEERSKRRKGYKLLRNDNQSLVLYHNNVVKYSRYHYVEGVNKTPLFLFDTLDDAIKFSEGYLPDVQIYECYYIPWVGRQTMMGHLLTNNFTKENLKDFWYNKQTFHTTEYFLPFGTVLATKVCITNKVD